MANSKGQYISGKFRRVVFTAFPKDFSQSAWSVVFKSLFSSKYTFYKVAHEQGGDGRDHLQGYLEFSRQLHFSSVQGLFVALGLPGAHFEAAISQNDSIEYIGNADFSHSDGRHKGGKVFWV